MAREARRLGEKQVATLKSPGFHPVGGVSGLGLKVTAKRGITQEGVARSWILRLATGEMRISASGRSYAVRRDFGLGGYPDVSLAEARQRASKIREQMRAGIDPVEEKKAQRLAQQAALAKIRTFEDVAQECHSVRQSEFKNAKHAAQWINTLNTYVFPTIGSLRVSEVTTAHLVEVLTPIWITKHETATRVRQRIGAVLDYATAAELRSGANPADMKGGLKDLLPKSSSVRKKSGGVRHHPRVPVSQIPAFMKDLRTRSSKSAKALEFAVLTASRSGEIRGATWGEIDMNARIWRINAERMKGDRVHRVPLSDAAMALLNKLPKGPKESLLFPGINGEMSDATLSKMLKDMHVKSVKSGDAGYLDPDQGRVATPHGTARSSFKDWSRGSSARKMPDGNSSSFPDEWSELALAHINSDATRAAYARSELLEERRELMQAWADYCASETLTEHSSK